MSGVRGNLAGIRGLNKRIRALGKETAIKIAKRSAGQISRQARGSFDSGMTAYNTARPMGLYGSLSLVQTGATRSSIGFTSDGGTKIRARLSKKYMRYLIGKYEILPNGPRARLPQNWRDQFRQLTDEVVKEELGD